jgi:alpha-beta hydrolase superfamily lysophospholipase
MQGMLLKALGAVAPGLGVPNGLQTRYLSHDPAVVAAYEKDPLVHPKISARLLTGMLEAGTCARHHAAVLKIPTLLLVAGDDRLVDASGSEVFYNRLSPGVGTMHRYADYYHEIFNEVGAARVFADLRDWLSQQETRVLKPEHAA